MYATPHAAVALAINTTVYAITGDMLLTLACSAPLAIHSHYYVDYLLEHGLSKKDNIRYEGSGTILFYLPLLLLPYSWLMLGFFIISWGEGNLYDWIDKKLYLSIFYPKKYPPTFYFHTQKRGVGIKFTLRMTKQASMVADIISWICGFILYNIMINN